MGDGERLMVRAPLSEGNGGMVGNGVPGVRGTLLVGGGIDITFNRPMRVSSVTAPAVVTVSVDGSPVAGTLVPLGAEDDLAGVSQARVYRFTPSAPFAAGTKVSPAVTTRATD